MPIYEYKCKRCGNIFEEIQELNASIFAKCTECGGRCSRILSTSQIVSKPSTQIRSFKPQWVNDIDHEPVFVKNRTELNDALKRHNDTKLANDVGKLRVHDGGLQGREI